MTEPARRKHAKKHQSLAFTWFLALTAWFYAGRIAVYRIFDSSPVTTESLLWGGGVVLSCFLLGWWRRHSWFEWFVVILLTALTNIGLTIAARLCFQVDEPPQSFWIEAGPFYTAVHLFVGNTFGTAIAIIFSKIPYWSFLAFVRVHRRSKSQ